MSTSTQHIARLLTGVVRRHPTKRVFVAGDQLQPPTLAFVVHFPILVVPIRGRYEVELERDGDYATICATPGQVIFAPPNCWTRPTWGRAMQAIHLMFGKEHVGASLVTTTRNRPGDVTAQKLAVPRSFGGPAHKTLDAILEAVRADAGSTATAFLVSALLHCIADELRQPTAERTGRTRRLFQDLCVYLQHNYHHNVTRDSIADHFRITPNHVSRVFKTEGSMRFSDYLTAVRIDRAKFLLHRYRLTVGEVATRCGYADVGYFCRVFKRFTRRTPSEYRDAPTSRRPGA
jgi:AraC-like DNA-binding protein